MFTGAREDLYNLFTSFRCTLGAVQVDLLFVSTAGEGHGGEECS